MSFTISTSPSLLVKKLEYWGEQVVASPRWVFRFFNLESRPQLRIALALSFFRFVEASQGRIVIDGLDISTLG